jgi:hypothetical protein
MPSGWSRPAPRFSSRRTGHRLVHRDDRPRRQRVLRDLNPRW